MSIMLFAKGGPGSGDHGHHGRPDQVGGSAPSAPAASGAIATAAQARAYWRAHFVGTRAFVSQAKAGPQTISVTFPDDNHHAWSRGAEPGEQAHAYDREAARHGPRTLDLDRATRMDLIREAIERPFRVVDENRLRDVFIGPRLPDGRSYVVWLQRREAGKLEFVTAFPRDAAWVKAKLAHNRPKLPGQMMKSHARGLFISPRAIADLPLAAQACRTPEGPVAIPSETDGRRVMASGNLHRPILFIKALPPGARWITVRPNGPGADGHAVLIQPSGDGAYRVIGGAGGKLNYLKLTGVKKEGEYKDEAAKRAKARAEEKKRRTKEDREAGISAGKTAARQNIRDQLKEREAKFVETVAEAMGWKPEETRFPEEKFQNASEPAQKKAAEQHARALMAKAREAVDQQRQALVQDADARAEADLAEIPLSAPEPDRISVQDLDPIDPTPRGLGFATEYGKRAEAAGLTPADLAEEASAAKPPPKTPPVAGEPTAAEKRKEVGQKIAAELALVREPGPKVDARQVIDARKAVDLLKAEKALKAARKAAQEQKAKVDAAKEAVEPKAYLIETAGQAVDQDVVRDLENDLRTLRTRSFLEKVAEAGGDAPLARHIGVGAYNSINAVALAAGGASLLDRSVVDVLGPAGAAQVLARRLATDLTEEELGHIREAMGAFHTAHYMETSDAALREARELHEMAAEIELGEAASGADLAAAQELNAKRREFTAAAQRTLGTALGEMETNAALVVALEQPVKKQLTVSLGGVAVEDAIRQARAIGLDRGDYQVERIGASAMLTVTGAGMDKLAQPIARDDLQRTRAALDIIEGRKDEEGWLPAGVANRPDLGLNVPPGVAPRLAQPFPQAPGDMEGAIKDYIAGRTADGDAPADIMADLLTEDVMQRAGDRGAFMEALNRIAPLYGADGGMIRAETHHEAFQDMADALVGRMGGARTAMHRQQVAIDQVAVDALHRALAKHPEGVAAFKPVGDLTPQDQAALRNAFVAEYGRRDPAVEEMRQQLGQLDAAPPEREADGLFGRETNPAYTDWQQTRNALAEKLNGATMTWQKYLDVMGSPAAGYAAMQDTIRSNVLRAFAEQHNRAKPDQPLKIGRQVIRNDLNHLDALAPEARERRLAEHRGMVDRLRNRAGGKYAAGAVSDKIDAARAAEEAAQQSQMGLFGAEEPGPADAAAKPEKPLEMGQRWSIGHAAERQVAGMMPHVGEAFRAGQPVKLWQSNMSGKYVGRQRAVKLIGQNRRMMLGLGVGSGKTSIALSAFTDMHSRGESKRGLFLVPSVVQGQFHGEALTMLEPGKYRWHANPGASREERIAAYKDDSLHFNVVTHQAFRDDMLHLAAKREGVETDAIAERLDAMSPAQRRDFMRDTMAAEGLNFDHLTVDEGHNLLNRQGKDNSRMANVIDGVAHGVGTYVNMTADPVKNDPSEIFDVLAKMDPARYSDRNAFMRRYGVDTDSSREGLKREMARHFYTGQIDPGVKANKKQIKVELDGQQTTRLAAIDDAASRARLARMQGKADVDAMKVLSPGSFAGVDEAQHADVAQRLNRSIGMLHEAAQHHAVNGGAKTEALAREAMARKGRPGVVFCRRLDRVDEIAARLRRDGHRVAVLTGKHSAKEKDRIKREYQAGEHDVLVASDAGAVGANLQHGKWLAQYDTPMTAMLHAQRNGRIHRMGQTEDVELLDFVANHPIERRARERLATKYGLRDIVTSPLEGLDDHGIAGHLNRVRAGQREAAQPHFMPAAPGEAPDVAEPDEQQGLF